MLDTKISDDEIARQFTTFGGFANALFDAWQRADSSNRNNIKTGFPALWERATRAALAARKAAE